MSQDDILDDSTQVPKSDSVSFMSDIFDKIDLVLWDGVFRISAAKDFDGGVLSNRERLCLLTSSCPGGKLSYNALKNI